MIFLESKVKKISERRVILFKYISAPFSPKILGTALGLITMLIFNPLQLWKIEVQTYEQKIELGWVI